MLHVEHSGFEFALEAADFSRSFRSTWNIFPNARVKEIHGTSRNCSISRTWFLAASARPSAGLRTNHLNIALTAKSSRLPDLAWCLHTSMAS